MKICRTRPQGRRRRQRVGKLSCRQKRLNNTQEEETMAASNWLDSYADMISLLFALFIVLYGMSKINEESFRQLAEALSKTLSTGGVASSQVHKDKSKSNVEQGGKNDENVQKSRGIVPNMGNIEAPKPVDEVVPNDLKEIEKKISLALKKHGMSSLTRIRMEERGLVIGLITDKLLFKIGDAELTKKCTGILNVVTPILKDIKHSLRIEGHTCNIPIKNSRFRSNWELSTMRATNVAWYLITRNKLNPRRISIMGYGEYQPLFKNNSETNRAKNRRVDIVILNVRRTFVKTKNSGGLKKKEPAKGKVEVGSR